MLYMYLSLSFSFCNGIQARRQLTTNPQIKFKKLWKFWAEDVRHVYCISILICRSVSEACNRILRCICLFIFMVVYRQKKWNFLAEDVRRQVCVRGVVGDASGGHQSESFPVECCLPLISSSSSCCCPCPCPCPRPFLFLALSLPLSFPRTRPPVIREFPSGMLPCSHILVLSLSLSFSRPCRFLVLSLSRPH